MKHDVTAIERAFQMAKSGEFASVADIRKQLKLEGYTVEHITGRALSKQLAGLIRAARETIPSP